VLVQRWVLSEQRSILNIGIAVNRQSIDLLEELLESHHRAACIGCIAHGILEVLGGFDEQ
jgi:hypothetical protein